jgi:hypothetical protein
LPKLEPSTWLKTFFDIKFNFSILRVCVCVKTWSHKKFLEFSFVYIHTWIEKF